MILEIFSNFQWRLSSRGYIETFDSKWIAPSLRSMALVNINIFIDLILYKCAGFYIFFDSGLYASLLPSVQNF